MMAQQMMVEPPMIRLPVAKHEALRSLADCAAAAGAAPASPGRLSAKPARGSPEQSRFTPRFSLGNVLGEGSYGVVEMCHERYTTTPHGTKIYACPAENAEAIGTRPRSPSDGLSSDAQGSCFGTFACKTVHKPVCGSNEDPRVLALVREIKVMKHLGKHPNIVQIKGVYNSKERLRLVMELCDGGDLLKLLKGKKYSVAQLNRLQRQQERRQQQKLSRQLQQQQLLLQQQQKQQPQQQQHRSVWGQLSQLGKAMLPEQITGNHKHQHHHDLLHHQNVATSGTSSSISASGVSSGKSAYILPLDHDGLPEPLAADIFRQLVSAVAHCHSHGVIHRDIKLENLLLTSCMPHQQQVPQSGDCSVARGAEVSSTAALRNGTCPFTVKLADFGLAKILKPPESEAIGDTGSKLYKAPEVYEHRWYTTQADMWSLGVVLYALLSARFPETDEKTGLLANTAPEVLFKSRLWGTVSAAAKDLISRLLSFDPAMRPTCEEALRHEWVRQGLVNHTVGLACTRTQGGSHVGPVTIPPAVQPGVVTPPMQQFRVSPMVPPPAATNPTSTATRAETGDAVRRDYEQSSVSILDQVWQQLTHEPPASTPRFSAPDCAVPSVKGRGGGRTSGSRLKSKRSPLRSPFRLMSLGSKPAAGSRT
ncbi:unnamed protein product [Closterium sp. NIES-53]